jgi:hypothetical protein
LLFVVIGWRPPEYGVEADEGQTSLPISTPVEARGTALVSMGCFSG